MNQSSPKSGRSSGAAPARVRVLSNENYLDALQALHTLSQPTWQPTQMETADRHGSLHQSFAKRARGCVLARTYQEKAAPKRLRRALPVGAKRVLGAAELLGRLNVSSFERLRRETRRSRTITASGKRPHVLLAGLLGLGLSSGALSSGALASAALVDAQYQIQSGDSLWAIARAHDLTVDQLRAANGLLQGDTIYAGEQLTIPVSASSEVAQTAQQARVAQKVALLGRLSDLKQEREARQQARGLPSETTSATSADDAALEQDLSASSATQTVAGPEARTPEAGTPEVRTVEQQKLANRLNQVISQDRRATQTVDSEVKTGVDSLDSSTNDPSTNDSSEAQKNRTSLSEFKAKMQRTAALRAAKKAALLERIQKDRAALKLARDRQQTRQIKLAQAQLERQQKRTEQARMARVSQPRVDTPLVNTSRHQATVRSAAYRYVGLRYRMGGTGRGSIDCSAFTQATLRHLGYRIPRTARAQSGVGSRVSFRNLRAGDLVFFNTLGRGVSHAGVYLGGGVFANANSYRGRVVVESINARYWTSRFITARRVLG